MESKASWVLSFIGILSYNLIVSLDSTALSVILPRISSALDASVIETYWCGTSFVLASAAAQPIFPPLSNAFGRKSLVLLALAVFSVGTIVCGTASNIAALIAGRTVQGIGGGGLTAMTYVILSDLFSLRERAKGIAFISLVWLFGVSLGPVTGGGFTASVTWRWTFWICLPFSATSIILVGGFLQTPHKKPNLQSAVKDVDWIGAVLFVASLVSFLMAISWGGSMFPWNSYHTLVPLCTGAVGLVATIVYESFVPRFPIIPIVLFSNRTAVFSYLGIMIVGIVQFGLLFYLPLFYLICKNYSPLVSGAALVPNCALAGISTGISGGLITKTGRYLPMLWFGWVFLPLGVGLELLLNPGTTIAEWFFINVPSGIGLGFLFAALPVASQASTPEKHKAIAGALSAFFRTVGQAVGIVLGNTIYQNVLKHELLNVASEKLQNRAEALATNTTEITFLLSNQPSTSPESQQLLTAFNQSLHAVWWTLLGVSIVGLLSNLTMRQFSLDRDRSVDEKTPESLDADC